MIGTWKGYYKYEDAAIQNAVGFDQTNFTIVIYSFDGRNFEGVVEDDLLSGGMEGKGQITGIVKEKKVSFRKSMPNYSLLLPDGSKKTLKRNHPNIYYSGTLSNDMLTIAGTWKFKWHLVFLFGLIPFPLKPIPGMWSMKLQ